MTSTIFCKIDGIAGESTDANHAGEMELMSFSHGISQPRSAAASTAGGATAGRCNHTDFSFAKTMDSSSPVLNSTCCTCSRPSYWLPSGPTNTTACGMAARIGIALRSPPPWITSPRF